MDLSDLVGRGCHLLQLDRLDRSIPVGLGHLEDLVGPEHHPYLQFLQALADPHDPEDQELRQDQQVQQGPSNLAGRLVPAGLLAPSVPAVQLPQLIPAFGTM